MRLAFLKILANNTKFHHIVIYHITLCDNRLSGYEIFYSLEHIVGKVIATLPGGNTFENYAYVFLVDYLM